MKGQFLTDEQLFGPANVGGASLSTPAPQPYQGFNPANALANIPGSAAKFGKDVGLGIANIVNPNLEQNTVANLTKFLAGGLQRAIGGGNVQSEDTQAFDAVLNFYKDRYGSPEKALQTIEKDPVGFMADLSTAFAGVAGAARVTRLGPVANVARKASRITNPITAVAKVVGPVARKYLPEIATSIEKSNLRLTPAQKTKLADKVEEIAQFNVKNNIVGSPKARLEKATTLYEQFEDTLQGFLKTTTGGVPKRAVITKLQELKQQFANNRDKAAIHRQIDSAIQVIQEKPGNIISYTDLNEFKRSTYSQAYNQAGDKVLDTVEHDIGDIARTEIEQRLQGLTINGKDIGAFNHDYGLLINSRKLLRTASGRPQVSGLTSRILGTLVGPLTGDVTGGIMGAAFGSSIAEGLPITAVRSGLASRIGDTGNYSTLGDAARGLTPLSRLEAGKKGATLLSDDEVLRRGKVKVISRPGKGGTTKAHAATIGGKEIVGGYDITSYATDPTHGKKVQSIYDKIPTISDAASVDRYIRSVAPNSPVKGADVIAAARQHKVSPRMMLAIMQQDSTFGTKGKAVRTFNPGNVGNTDDGGTKNYGDWKRGVLAVAQNLSWRKLNPNT